MSSAAVQIASQPLRIVFCITELNVGGAERCLVELATGLDRSRFAPSVYCLGPRPTGNAAALCQRLDDANVPVKYLNARHAISAWRVLRQLRRLFRANRPDLLQTFLWHANVLGTLAAWSAGVPKIVTGLRVAEPLRPWRRPVERLVARLADRHVAVSEGVVEFARARIGLRAEKIVVIPNGVVVPSEPLAAADLTQFGLPPGRRALLFVGRLDEQKGIEWLVEQLPELFARLPNHDLLLVGAGPLEARLRSRVARLRVTERVHFTGWRGDVPSILAAADLLVVPSQWEGMSNAALEAMAAARPIVAYDVEGIVDAIGDRSSPQIVACQDRVGFVPRVAEIAGNLPLGNELGQANRRRVEAHFRQEKMNASYERLYLELCGRLSRPTEQRPS